jgi:hypothetical protein
MFAPKAGKHDPEKVDTGFPGMIMLKKQARAG